MYIRSPGAGKSAPRKLAGLNSNPSYKAGDREKEVSGLTELTRHPNRAAHVSRLRVFQRASFVHSSEILPLMICSPHWQLWLIVTWPRTAPRPLLAPSSDPLTCCWWWSASVGFYLMQNPKLLLFQLRVYPVTAEPRTTATHLHCSTSGHASRDVRTFTWCSPHTQSHYFCFFRFIMLNNAKRLNCEHLTLKKNMAYW